MYKRIEGKCRLLVATAIYGFALISSQSQANAFGLNPNNGALNQYNPTADYEITGTEYTVSLDPANVKLTNERIASSFLAALQADSNFGTNSGWSYTLMPRNTLQGVFNINNYYACPHTNLPACGIDPRIKVRNGPGAFLDLAVTYNPNDPNQPGNAPSGLNFRWIQLIDNNHNLRHGDVANNRVDNGGVPDVPFYPIFGNNRFTFLDNPARMFDPSNSHFWDARLFLVDALPDKKVNIYDGISWGWDNYCKQTSAGVGNCKDWGDAPDSYSTTETENGPRYGDGELQKLGKLWDKEIDGQPSSLSDGDDLAPPFDDEDGVIFGNSWVDVIFNIGRPDPNTYQLRAWWDTNYNGVFDHISDLGSPEELYIDDLLTLSPGVFTKRYNLSFDPKANGLYSRFRLTWDPLDLDVKPFGEYYSRADCSTANAAVGNCISHGEVEDYVHVPGPLPLFGVGAAFGYSRKLRKRIKSSKSSDVMSTID